MTTLLSVPLAIVLTALLCLVVIAVAITSVLLALLALLALDLLLERNGVDRRAHVLRFWRRLRRPAPTDRRAEDGAAEPPVAPAPRVPFSARRPARPEPTTAPAPDRAPDEQTPVVEAIVAAPESRAQPEPEPAVVIEATESPTLDADAVTEVLVVPPAPVPRTRAPRVTRPPRPTPRRTPAPEPGPAPSSAPETEPVDRDSALDRLFAPLLESDRTEPLPRTTRAARRPRDDD